MAFDKIKIDDPVGAISVHLVCGIWGTLAVGLFSTNPEHAFLTQLAGVACYGIFTVICATSLFMAIKATMGLRVSEEEEIEGLDLGEHGMHAWDVHVGGNQFDAPSYETSAKEHVPAGTLATES
jgi:Amt family ammonium transporter